MRYAASCVRRAASFCVVLRGDASRCVALRRAGSCCVVLRCAASCCVALRRDALRWCSVLRMRVVVYIRTCTSFSHLVIH